MMRQLILLISSALVVGTASASDATITAKAISPAQNETGNGTVTTTATGVPTHAGNDTAPRVPAVNGARSNHGTLALVSAAIIMTCLT